MFDSARIAGSWALPCVVVGLGLAWSSQAFSKPVETQAIELEVGQQTTLSARGVAKYSEGVPGVVDIRLPEDAHEFIVVGLRPGVTTLLLIYDDGRRLQVEIAVNSTDQDIEETENIRLDLYFVEISQAEGYQVGVSWPSRIGGQLGASLDLTTGSLSSATASVSGIPLPRLDMLSSTGWAKVSRQASVITANGKPAEFNSGGEVLIPVEGALAAELHKLSFGTQLKVLPRYDSETGRLDLRIDADVSSLTNGAGELPSRSVSRLATVVNLEMNQAVVLAGIVAQAERGHRDGKPLLSRIPVLGYLFGSKGKQREDVQNVLFIVPSVVDVVSMDARQRIDEALSVFENYEGTPSRYRLMKGAP